MIGMTRGADLGPRPVEPVARDVVACRARQVGLGEMTLVLEPLPHRPPAGRHPQCTGGGRRGAQDEEQKGGHTGQRDRDANARADPDPPSHHPPT